MSVAKAGSEAQAGPGAEFPCRGRKKSFGALPLNEEAPYEEVTLLVEGDIYPDPILAGEHVVGVVSGVHAEERADEGLDRPGAVAELEASHVCVYGDALGD